MATTISGVVQEEMSERDKMLSQIVQSLSRSCENESWGLMVEAAEDYQRTCYKLKHAALPEGSVFSQDEKDLFLKISTALYHKYTILQNLSSVDQLSSKAYESIDSKSICAVLQKFEKGLLTTTGMATALKELIPPPSSGNGEGVSARPLREDGQVTTTTTMDPEDLNLQTFLNMPEDEYEHALEKATERKAGTLLRRSGILHGYSYLNITIEKIELKDPQNYIDPFITVSVKSLIAENIEVSQDTPVMSERNDLAIVFNVTVQILRPVEEIPGGSGIFFELKHYKPKKGITSTKCFSFMEMDEIKPGRTYLEIYKKPTDFRRKKLSLLSTKLKFLHLNLTLEKP